MTGSSRRDFLRYGSAVVGASALTNRQVIADMTPKEKPIRIVEVDSNFEREPLHPYRFKGSAITQSWQTAAYLRSDSGAHKIGLATQGILWSDSKVFAEHSENAGNAIMYAMSERALQMLKGQSFTNPISLLDELLPEVLAYGKTITRSPDLRTTFALGALVGIDNAAWLLYGHENGLGRFDDWIPPAYRTGLSYRHRHVASIPSFSVGTAASTIKRAADEGYFVLKLKTGAAGTQSEMIEKDIAFLTAVHQAIGSYETPHTDSGKIPYYFDANGRYETKQTLLRFLDHAQKIGAFDQIAVIEEPLDERNETYVGDLGVCVAADESAHTVEDAAVRIDQGYGAIAVKAIAKTLSMTMKITQLAFEKNIPCFCADLTVNPILVDWNKCIAARLPPFPGMKVGLQETNGRQYFRAWDKLMTYHPAANATWITARNGVFTTDDSFYDQSGGILASSPHYESLFQESDDAARSSVR